MYYSIDLAEDEESKISEEKCQYLHTEIKSTENRVSLADVSWEVIPTPPKKEQVTGDDWTI